jgi:uncharacterized membrane protein
LTYLAIKWLHLLGASLLFGTGLGIAFFAWFGYRAAMRDGEIGLLRGVLRLTVIADAMFTATAAILQPITGLALWSMQGASWQSRWLLWVLAVYALVGACWLPVVVMQIRLRDAAMAAPSTSALGFDFHARFRRWLMLGWPAFIGVLFLFGLMIGRGYWD